MAPCWREQEQLVEVEAPPCRGNQAFWHKTDRYSKDLQASRRPHAAPPACKRRRSYGQGTDACVDLLVGPLPKPFAGRPGGVAHPRTKSLAVDQPGSS